jgi:hypothetical protein
MVWGGMRRAWAIAFVVTWLVVTVILNNNGWSDNDSVRIAVVVAAIVAAAVWYVGRTRGRARGAPPPEE